MTAKLLARTSAVLASIDQALDDPHPAAVARLPGVAGSWWPCHHPEVVQIGATEHTCNVTVLAPMLIAEDCTPDPTVCVACVPDEIFDVEGCWAYDDYDVFDLCGDIPCTSLGLCAYHFDQIVPQEATP